MKIDAGFGARSVQFFAQHLDSPRSFQNIKYMPILAHVTLHGCKELTLRHDGEHDSPRLAQELT